MGLVVIDAYEAIEADDVKRLYVLKRSSIKTVGRIKIQTLLGGDYVDIAYMVIPKGSDDVAYLNGIVERINAGKSNQNNKQGE